MLQLPLSKPKLRMDGYAALMRNELAQPISQLQKLVYKTKTKTGLHCVSHYTTVFSGLLQALNDDVYQVYNIKFFQYRFV